MSDSPEPHTPLPRPPSDLGAVLVTGGAGYIGAHVAQALRRAGWPVVVYDDLSHGFEEACLGAELVRGDVRDRGGLADAMRRFGVGSVIHLAGLIEVGRSAVRPDLFWDHNVTGVAALLGAMRDADARRLVFSSSAAVYGQASGARRDALLREDDPKDPASAYGDTKLAGERMIAAHCRAFGLSAMALRYFNAAGADPQGRLGEAHEPETHLIPLAIEAAQGRRPALTLFGDDFPTPDGSCVRDYVHVTDLAEAHLLALAGAPPARGFEALNIGTGRGHSVFEVIAAVERLVGPVPRTLGARRHGDPASLVADASRARARLNWSPRLSGLDQIVATAARWHAAPAYGRNARAPALEGA